jgi:CYTH domain-containing protein
MAQKLEIERKFQVLNFWSLNDAVRRALLVMADRSEIIQIYLKSKNGSERRIRKVVHNGVTSYFYTVKHSTKDPRVRIESDKKISKLRYLWLSRQHDPSMQTIRKDRYKFPFMSHILELDVYRGFHQFLVILEVELEQEDEKVELPHALLVREVTDNKNFKNANIARMNRGEFSTLIYAGS